MDFTPRETKLIERLRKQEGRWQWARWVLLGMAAFVLLCYGYIAYMLYDFFVSHFDSDAFDRDAALLMFAMVWPKIIMMSGVAGLFIALAIRDWHGNATRMLLLKLLDAQQKQTRSDQQGV